VLRIQLADGDLLFRSGVAGGSEGFAKELVGVEIDLPVVVGVGVRTDGENGPEEVEVEDFDVGSGIGNNVGDGEQFLFQESDSGVGIDGAVELGGAINATERGSSSSSEWYRRISCCYRRKWRHCQAR